MHTVLLPQRQLPPAYTIAVKPQPSLTLAWRGCDGYEALALHIATVYRKTYGADIEVVYPLLMGFVDAYARPLSALGIRCAVDESPLFLEQYLDHPAEIYLQAITGQPVSRLTIAEAGNMASTGKGDILKLLYGLACHLEQEGMSHILFTGTALLKRYLHSLGLHPYVLAEASPACLKTGAERWGTYYSTHPKVMAGSVPAFRAGLEHYFRHAGKRFAHD